MSSKNAESRNNERAKFTSAWSWSITGRLTFLYAVSTFGLLVLSTAFLYWALANYLEREAHQFLADKIHELQLILREHPEGIEALKEEVKLESAAFQFAKYYARILDEADHILIETPGMGNIAKPSDFPLPAETNGVPGRGTKKRSARGRLYLLLTAWAAPSPHGENSKRIQLALDISGGEATLANFRRKLAVVLVLGMLFSAGAGVAVARKGMRPLKEVTRAAQRITATQLHERIGPARWPKELLALATAFDAMLSRLEEAFIRLAQFSADLAHELRTPINNLMGESEVALSRTRTPDEYRQVLESSLEEYARLSRMIDSLLFLARADSTEIRIERTCLDASREIELVREFHEAMAEEHEVAITCHGQALLNADPALFRRAISNLLSNALQYTPSGGTIRLCVQALDDQSVEVSVSDTGSGIDPKHLPRLFDRFYRADPARSHPQGTGLGLAIVKSIMDLHGGTVSIQSVPAQGTVVTLKFPHQPKPDPNMTTL